MKRGHERLLERREVMQKCKECDNGFKYKDILKSIWFQRFGYEPIVCDKCKTTHYVHYSTRVILSFLILLPVLSVKFAALIYDYYIILPDYSLVLLIIWLIINVFITPLYARYYIKGAEKN